MSHKAVFEHKTDVLVIGGGLAGLVAALTAAEESRVLLLAKTPRQQSSSVLAQGGIAAAVSPEDSPKLHLDDTIRAGRGLCNMEAVELLTNSAPEMINKLAGWGVRFDRENGGGTLSLGREGGHSRRRIIHALGAATGKVVVEALFETARTIPRITIIENLEIFRLITRDSRCVGALGFDKTNHQTAVISAKAVILATGGAADLYERTTTPPSSDGSGVALAYEAGAEIEDIEFIQFHPTALNDTNHRALLISEAVRGEGAYLLNAAGVRFMPALHELAELAPRDIVARAIDEQIQKTGTVYLSLGHLDPALIEKRFGPLIEACKARGFDLAHDLIPVAPAAHYTCGGVKTDLNAATSIAGLYASGEVACTGVHGANRLASNSLLECAVFGERAGRSATQIAAQPWSQESLSDVPAENLVEAPELCQKDLQKIHTELKKMMTEQVGLFRDAAGLQSALHKINEIENELNRAAESMDLLRMRHRLLVARLIASAALQREETRGAHARRDFSKEDPAWQRHITLKMN